MRRFVDDDAGYVAWLEAHPRGYVLNTYPHLTSTYLVLHRSSCGTVNRPLAEGRRWTHQFGKACSEDHAELAEWALRETGKSVHGCRACGPPAGNAVDVHLPAEASAARAYREVELPSSLEVTAAHEQYLRVEGRDVVYRVARHLVEQAYNGDAQFTVAEGVAVLLLSWNAAFYRPRPVLTRTLVDDLDRLIQAHAPTLDRFRTRDVKDYEPAADSGSVEELYRDFVGRLWPVGTAKALHVLAPRFFPLWDDEIARKFRLQLSPREASVKAYLSLVGIGRRFARSSDLADPLKALDEWAYVTFTVPRRRQPPH